MAKKYAILAAAALTAIAAWSSPLQAQAQSSEIIVTGHAATPRQVKQLVRAVTPYHGSSKPLARFTDPICPEVDGLPSPYNKMIEDRIRADAIEAHAQVGGTNCTANLLVMLVDNGQKAVSWIANRKPFLFGSLDVGEINRLTADPGPVHGWSAIVLRSRDGDEVKSGQIPTDTTDTNVSIVPRFFLTVQVHDAHLMFLPTRLDVTSSFLLIDKDAVLGMTLTQIADYAAMRTLAQAVPAQSDATILGLFGLDPKDRPTRLTTFDRLYLAGLFKSGSNKPAMMAIPEIAGQISNAVQREQ